MLCSSAVMTWLFLWAWALALINKLLNPPSALGAARLTSREPFLRRWFERGSVRWYVRLTALVLFAASFACFVGVCVVVDNYPSYID